MSDVKKTYDEIIDFLNNETEKTLLLRGIADVEKHQVLLKALNAQGNLKGLINLLHTTKSGMSDFFRWAEIYKVKVPKKYGEGMRLSNLTIFFDNITTNNSMRKYDKYEFDFMIIWPIQSVTKNDEKIDMLKEMANEQKTRKIIYLSLKEPWYNPDPLNQISDRVIKLDCENDNREEYNRIMEEYEKDIKRRDHY
ncbi:MAG TPA: hypothetical protein GX531_07635 [Methanothermobacter sp.]|nr:hypothetical protein [Methanothermobacter sp.]